MFERVVRPVLGFCADVAHDEAEVAGVDLYIDSGDVVEDVECLDHVGMLEVVVKLLELHSLSAWSFLWFFLVVALAGSSALGLVLVDFRVRAIYNSRALLSASVSRFMSNGAGSAIVPLMRVRYHVFQHTYNLLFYRRSLFFIYGLLHDRPNDPAYVYLCHTTVLCNVGNLDIIEDMSEILLDEKPAVKGSEP